MAASDCSTPLYTSFAKQASHGCGPCELDVQSRHVVDRVQSESLRLFGLELTDSFKGSEPTKTLESLGEIVRIEKGSQMRAKTFVGRVEEATDGRVLDGAVHAFDLAVGPRMVECREAMLDAVLSAPRRAAVARFRSWQSP